MTRVLVVEDQRALADALQIAIDVQPDLECAGVVATAEDALKLTAAQDPDIVLMDVHLHGPGPDGIEATRQIKEYAPGIRVLILTADSVPDLFSGATAAGADGFLAKDSALPDILAAIRTPADKTVMVEGATLAALFKDYRREESPDTPREEN
jgi:DNA-binding NarL/FixJ family response regulator